LFVRSRNKAKRKGKMVFSWRFLTLNSPRLASISLRLKSNFNPKQATRLGEWMPSPLGHNSPRQATTRLGEFPCTALLCSINGHACLKRKRIQQHSNTRENTKEEGVEEKWSRGTAELWPWITSVVISLVSLVLCVMLG